MLNVQLFPAMSQRTEYLTSLQQDKVSKLVPLSEKLAAWKLLPNISPWVLKTVPKGYRIQFPTGPYYRETGAGAFAVKLCKLFCVYCVCAI